MEKTKLLLKMRFIITTLAFVMLLLPYAPVFSAQNGDAASENDTTATAASPKAPTVPHPELVLPSDSDVTESETSPAEQNSVANEEAALQNDQAVAEEDTTSNTKTAASSDNSSVDEEYVKRQLENENVADLDNNLQVAGTTGGNEASYNTGNAEITTGDANVTLSIINLVNSMFAGLYGGEMKFVFQNIYGDLNENYIIDPLTGEAYSLTGARISAENLGVGNGSINTSLINSNSGTSITNNNDANLSNRLNVSADTGNNSANYNTGNGNIITGDANVSLNLVNFVNSNFVVTEQGLFLVLNIFGDWLGDLLIPEGFLSGSGETTGAVIVNNAETGNFSVNTAGASDNSLLNISNNNNANIDNNIDLEVNTGGNGTNYNTKNGLISTGDAFAKLNLANIANQNILGNFALMMVNVLGSWDGANLLPGMYEVINSQNQEEAVNTATGIYSENYAETNIGKALSISNNNTGSLLNNINLSANTGNNTASYNTGSGSISTGNANILANILNLMNMNVVSGKGLYVIVNIFGDWTGNINLWKETAAEKNSGKQAVVKIKAKDGLSEQSYYVSKSSNSINNDLEEAGEKQISGTYQNQKTESQPVTDLTKNAENNTSAYSPVEFVKAYLKIVLPVLVVSYLAFIALYYRKRSNRASGK